MFFEYYHDKDDEGEGEGEMGYPSNEEWYQNEAERRAVLDFNEQREHEYEDDGRVEEVSSESKDESLKMED